MRWLSTRIFELTYLRGGKGLRRQKYGVNEEGGKGSKSHSVSIAEELTQERHRRGNKKKKGKE